MNATDVFNALVDRFDPNPSDASATVRIILGTNKDNSERDGVFDAECSPPRIKIFCVFDADRPSVANLFALAHEIGHYLRWRGKPLAARDAYREARTRYNDSGSVTPEDVHLVMREERRAWKLAARTLRRVGKQIDWAAYRRARRMALNTYVAQSAKLLAAATIIA